jgi:hypothetical protein
MARLGPWLFKPSVHAIAISILPGRQLQTNNRHGKILAIVEVEERPQGWLLARWSDEGEILLLCRF